MKYRNPPKRSNPSIEEIKYQEALDKIEPGKELDFDEDMVLTGLMRHSFKAKTRRLINDGNVEGMIEDYLGTPSELDEARKIRESNEPEKQESYDNNDPTENSCKNKKTNVEDFSIENSARSEAEQKIIGAAIILLRAAKKLEKQPGKLGSIKSLKEQAMELLDSIEPEIVKIFLDENDRLDYWTKDDEIDARIIADEMRDERDDWASEWYDEAQDQGQGMYLSDGVYLKADGSLVDTKAGK